MKKGVFYLESQGFNDGLWRQIGNDYSDAEQALIDMTIMSKESPRVAHRVVEEWFYEDAKER